MRRLGHLAAAGRRLCAAALAAALAAAALPAHAQDVDCAGLEADRAAIARDVEQTTGWELAAERQQEGLDRLRAYAQSLGCGAEDAFGDAPVPECEPLEARIERLQESVQDLRERTSNARAATDARRRDLDRQIGVSCREERPLPDAQNPNDPGREASREILGPPDGKGMAPETDQAPGPTDESGHLSKALCVRACDGGFFPITDEARSDQIERLGQLCQALCPNAQASLYTTGPSGDLSTAVAADGTPYSALPAAYRFQKTYDATCSCKPPHMSWAEALATAERMIEHDKSDVVVTKRISDQMAKAGPPTPAASTSAGRAKASASRVKAKAAHAPRPLPPLPEADALPPASDIDGLP